MKGKRHRSRSGARVVAGALALLAAVTGRAAAGAEKVIGWRAGGSGHFPKATPPTRFSEHENLTWKADVGQGCGAAIVVGDRLLASLEPHTLRLSELGTRNSELGTPNSGAGRGVGPCPFRVPRSAFPVPAGEACALPDDVYAQPTCDGPALYIRSLNALWRFDNPHTGGRK
jgi:hypothetical protein